MTKQHPFLARSQEEPRRDRTESERHLERQRRGRGNFLPGPVRLHPEVLASLAEVPSSHREETYQAEAQRLRVSLARLAGLGEGQGDPSAAAQGGRSTVSLLVGSGTLANESIAARLASDARRHSGPQQAGGLVLVNGEFGHRLSLQARRWGLEAKTIESPWGEDLDLNLARQWARQHRIGWIWAVLCETSTGVWNDLGALKELAQQTDALLCLDAISAFGAEPVDLSGVAFASASSGKALGAPAGLALVFHPADLEPRDDLPSYLDLGLYRGEDPPFTISTPWVRALAKAVDLTARGHSLSLEQRAQRGRWLRSELTHRGWPVLGTQAVRPALSVVTLPMSSALPASWVAEELWRRGFAVSHRSSYLRQRGWLQICLMGFRHDPDEMLELLDALDSIRDSVKSAPGR